VEIRLTLTSDKGGTVVRKISKRKVAATIAITAILIGGGGAAAIAYWSAGGTGSGSATTGTSANITVNETVPTANLTPGGTTVALSGTFTNTNSGPVTITSVTATITGTSNPSCLASDYSLSNGGVATVPSGATSIPTGTNVGAWSGLTLAMANTALDQNACKGATVNVTYAAN
jgi:hypothetical protein